MSKLIQFFSTVLTEVSGGADGGERAVRERLLPPLRRVDPVWQREPDLPLGELHAVGPLELARAEGGRADDLDGAGAAAVAPGHLVVELGHGPDELQVAVLAVHVVRARPGIVAEPDAVVLHDAAVLLDDFDAVEDLAGRLLHLAELAHEVPELGLGGDGVGGEDDHAVGLGVGILLGRGLAADDLILAHQSGCGHDLLTNRVV